MLTIQLVQRKKILPLPLWRTDNCYSNSN